MTCTLNYVHDVILRIIHVYYLCCYSGLVLCCKKESILDSELELGFMNI